MPLNKSSQIQVTRDKTKKIKYATSSILYTYNYHFYHMKIWILFIL